MDKPDLSLASTNQLLDEVLRRFDCAVFVGVKDITVRNEYITRHWKGPLITGAGLCQWMQRKLFDEYAAVARDADDEGIDDDN